LKLTKPKDDTQTRTSAITPEQQAIITRAESELAEWEPITEESMHDFSLADHPLDIRIHFPEAHKQEAEKRYAFRWCERTDKRIDELTRSGHPMTRWKLCTRTTTPFLEQYVDPIWGCVTRLDQVLLFRPYDRHMMEQNAKTDFAKAKAASGKPENVALRRAQDGIEAYAGPEYQIGSRDEVQYEDTRDFSDLVVDD
jgi:hypothetical protein